MQVIITKKHCEKSSGYASNENCPLCVALNEQYPQFGLFHAGGTYVRNIANDNLFFFDGNPSTGWCSLRVNELLNGEIKKYVLDIPYPDYDNNAPKVKEIIRYVAVPETISEMETVLN